MSEFDSPPSTKVCPDCGLEKSTVEFRRDAKRLDGLGFYCRSCVSRREKAAYRKRQARAGKTVRERVEAPDGYKWCPGCKSLRALGDWGRNKRSRDGYNSYCKECKNARSARDYLRKTHKLTPEDVTRLIREQGDLCMICVRAPARHVDHDHITGERRGILCFNCNVALGQFNDDPWVLRRAIEYLSGGLLGVRRKADGTFEVAEVRRTRERMRDDWGDRDFALLDARVRGDSGEPWETEVGQASDEAYEPRFAVLDLSSAVVDEPLPSEPVGEPEYLCALG
jgi:hypothetical protein